MGHAAAHEERAEPEAKAARPEVAAAAPPALLQLQRTAGNQAVLRLLARKEAKVPMGYAGLGTLDEATRKSLKEVTGVGDVKVPAKSTIAKMTLEPSPEFEAGTPVAFREPLTQVLDELLRGWLREPNTTAAILLDLSAHGGVKTVWRFTHLGPKTRYLVELVTNQAAMATPADTKFKAHGFSFSGGSADFKAVVYQAVELIPDAMLSLIDGVTFKRAGKAKDDPDRTAGNYDAATHTVTLFDLGMKTGGSRFDDGAGGQSPVDDRVRKVVHELGHAIDEVPLRKALANQSAAQATLLKNWGQYVKLDASGDIESWDTGGDIALSELAKLKAGIAAYKKVVDAAGKALAETGHGLEGVKPKIATAFKTAYDADGGKPLTPYVATKVAEYDAAKTAAASAADAVKKLPKDASKDDRTAAKDAQKVAEAARDDAQAEIYTEAYAEAFSLYITEPETLKALRPKIYAFFKKKDDALQKAAAAAAKKKKKP